MPLLLILTIGWTLGIWAAAQVLQPGWAWLAISALAGLGLWLRRADPRWRAALAAGVMLGLGGLRYVAAQPPAGPGDILSHAGQEVILEGMVSAEPEWRETRSVLRVEVDTLLPPEGGPQAVRGPVLVYAPRYDAARLEHTGLAEYQYGDRLRLAGQLEIPAEFPDFSFREHLARQGVHVQLAGAEVVFVSAGGGEAWTRALLDLKTRAARVLAQTLPEPHAALLQGILLGLETGIPADIRAAFSATGTSHIVAISGFNIAILAGLFAALAGRAFGPRRGAVAAVLGVAFYTVLVGASASVVRAALMGSLALAARQIGRRAAGLNTLAFAALVMTLANPLTLWDVGFQLSLGATLGLVLYADRLQKGFEGWVGGWLPQERAQAATAVAGEVLLLTLSAQITTLPLLTYYFRSLSLVSLVANAIILPVQPALMMVGGLAMLLGLVWLPAGQLVAWIAWPLSAFTIAFVRWFARWPAASIQLGDVAPAVVVVFFAALAAVTWLFELPPGERPAGWAAFQEARWPRLALAGLALGAFWAWSWFFSLPESQDRLRVTVLDVGHGDAVLIQAPSGARALVDGGPGGRALARALDGTLPLFTTRLDLMVMAAPGDDSLGALPEVLARFETGRAVLTSAPGQGGPYRALLAALQDHNVPVTSAADRPSLDLGGGTWLHVLADGPNGSLLRLEHGRFSMLIGPGLGTEDEAALLAQGVVAPATALLAARHGAPGANHEAWLAAVDPHLVLIPVGLGNADGLPDRALLRRLAGRTVLRTDLHGALTLETDGQRWWVETGK